MYIKFNKCKINQLYIHFCYKECNTENGNVVTEGNITPSKKSTHDICISFHTDGGCHLPVVDHHS